MLQDTVVQATHQIQPGGTALLSMLHEGASFAQLQAKAYSLAIERSQVIELLGFLNLVGGLQQQRTCKSAIKIWCTRLKHFLLGVMYPPLSSRSEATGKHISIGITLACRSVIAAGLALGLLIGAANLLPMRSALGMTAFGLLTFVGSMVLHEFTHLLVIKQEIATVDILRRGLRIGLIHRETTNMIAIASSLAGPAAGMAYCGCLALAAHLLQAPLCSILALIAASFHLWALLPWFGDGSSLYKAIKRRKNTT